MMMTVVMMEGLQWDLNYDDDDHHRQPSHCRDRRRHRRRKFVGLSLLALVRCPQYVGLNSPSWSHSSQGTEATS